MGNVIPEMNPHIPQADAEKDARLWAVKNRVSPKDHEKPFSFEREVVVNVLGQKRPIPLKYLDEIYATLQRLKNLYLVVEKPRQCMISEFNVNSTFYICDTHKNTTVLYILQDQTTGEEFVKKRVDTAIDDSPYLQTLLNSGQARKGGRDGRRKQIDSLKMKKFRRSWFYMVHSSSNKRSRSVDADVVIFDEYDAHETGQEKSFRACADNSDIRAYFYTSTPTIKDFGVDLKIKTTSHALWHINCAHCFQDFIMDSVYFFGDGIKILDEPRLKDGALRIFVCPHCGEEVRQEDKMLRGRWVHQHPERIKENRIGFQFSHLILPHITADRAYADYLECLSDPKSGKKGYYNDNLGEAFNDEEAGARFTREIIWNSRNENFDWCKAAHDVTIGVDWGKDTHVSIMKRIDEGTRQLQYLEYIVIPASKIPVDNAIKIFELFPTYQPDMVIADFGAGQEQNKCLLDKMESVGMGNNFYMANNHNSMKNVNPKWNEETHMVTYDLVTLYSTAALWFAANMVWVPGAIKGDQKLELMIKHFTNYYIVDPNKDNHADGVPAHLTLVKPTLPKQLMQNGPVHILSSFLFGFLTCMGNAAETWSTSDAPKDGPTEDEIAKARYTSRPWLKKLPISNEGNVLCQRL
jgi:hypothetical protein